MLIKFEFVFVIFDVERKFPYENMISYLNISAADISINKIGLHMSGFLAAPNDLLGEKGALSSANIYIYPVPSIKKYTMDYKVSMLSI